MTVQVGDWIAHKFHHPTPEWCAGLVLCEKKPPRRTLRSGRFDATRCAIA